MPAKRCGLAERRVAVGHSQEKLAEEVGVEFTTIGRWERGATTPQPTSRPKLADALTISSEELDRLLAEGQPVKNPTEGPLSDEAEETDGSRARSGARSALEPSRYRRSGSRAERW